MVGEGEACQKKACWNYRGVTAFFLFAIQNTELAFITEDKVNKVKSMYTIDKRTL